MREFGSNMYSSCYFNLQSAINRESNDIYELFIEDNVGNDIVLRPIPILIRNYRNEQGSNVNTGTNTRLYKLFRRFFTLDVFTSSETIQYTKNVTIIFQ